MSFKKRLKEFITFRWPLFRFWVALSMSLLSAFTFTGAVTLLPSPWWWLLLAFPIYFLSYMYVRIYREGWDW